MIDRGVAYLLFSLRLLCFAGPTTIPCHSAVKSVVTLGTALTPARCPENSVGTTHLCCQKYAILLPSYKFCVCTGGL
jgi:hypothetical protein